MTMKRNEIKQFIGCARRNVCCQMQMGRPAKCIRLKLENWHVNSFTLNKHRRKSIGHILLCFTIGADKETWKALDFPKKNLVSHHQH